MIAEIAETKGKPWSKRTVLERHTRNGRTYELVHKSPGWETAGSMARMRDTECWSVLFMFDGAVHEQAFKTREEATTLLDRWIK